MTTLIFGVFKLSKALAKVYLPRRPKGEFGGEFEAGSLAELPNVIDSPLAYPKGRFLLVNTETGLLALHRACTHLDCLVNWDDGAQKFVCPCHGSAFSREGVLLQGPAQRSLDRFPLRVLSPEGEVVAQSDYSGELMEIDRLLDDEQEGGVPVDSLVIVDTGNKIQSSPNG